MAKASKFDRHRIPALLAGVAGEYFVAAELSRRGYIASISLRNTRGIDILVTSAAAARTVTIQCKTTQLARKVWVLSESCEGFQSPTHFYVFVALGSLDSRPTYHIVPSEVVARRVADEHRAWLARPGRGGRPHADNPVRQFSDCGDEYLERWELLGLQHADAEPFAAPDGDRRG